MGAEILIFPLAVVAVAVLLGAATLGALTQRVAIRWLCGLLWVGALLIFAANYTGSKTLIQNLLLSLMACGLFVVMSLPVLVVGALVALPFKRFFASEPHGRKESQ